MTTPAQTTPAQTTPAVTIPTIDLRTATPADLVQGLISSSCVFLSGHGVTDDELAAVLATGSEFFSLPEEQKAAVRWSGEGPWLGWQPVYLGGPSAMLLERFEVRLAPGGHDRGLQDWASTFELWPEEPANMAIAWSQMYRRMHGLASAVTTMIAVGLGLPASELPAWTDRQHSNLVLNHYLRQDTAPEPGRVRQRPHSDIGGITLLWADDSPGGLEAKIGPDGEWIPISIPRGALLLQAGDLLNVASGGRIPANLHRVVNPPRTAGEPQRDRYSAVYFHHPDLTTRMAPVTADQTESDEGVAAIGHVLARQQFSAKLDAQG